MIEVKEVPDISLEYELTCLRGASKRVLRIDPVYCNENSWYDATTGMKSTLYNTTYRIIYQNETTHE